jgi:two-component system, cell cycle sensor histidine kinase and response regulator CckA
MGAEADDRSLALEAEVRRLKAMLESAPNFITRITLDGKFLYLNQLAPGFRMEDVIGTSIDDYVPEAFRERAREAMRQAVETRTVQEYSTLGQISADRIGHYLTRVSPVVENGVVTSLVMIATDVTALAEQRVLLQHALDATSLGIWTYEPATGIAVWDATTRRIFGVPATGPSLNLNEIMAERIHPDDRDLVTAGLAEVMREGHYGPMEHRIRTGDGSTRWLSASSLAVRDHRGEIVRIVGSVQDVTERRALEARLRDAQKLESVGRLAGGIAHDFNNMLTAILGNVAFAATVDSVEDVRPLLAEIRTAAERSAALTAQLLAFARRQMIDRKVVEPNALIQRLDALLRRLVGERIRMRVSLLAEGWVQVGESQFEQVVLNLVTNARDAMPSGGSLTIETSDVVLDRADATALDLPAGRYVKLSVRDTGPGIASDLLPHLFEPFFTTREGGTGLGLATCYGIVKQSGGHLTVDSALGQGATFNVYLPRVEAANRAAAAPTSTSPGAAARKVLVVEDEPIVRAVIERTLRERRYRVSVAGSAAEAFALADREGPFDLLVTDVAMPDVDGRELAQALVTRWSTLLVLFVSGYAQEFTLDAERDPGKQFLQKPFEPSELLQAVESLLSQRARPTSRARS